MVQHYASLSGVNLQDTCLTIGSFDGVHMGHQQLIKELNQNAHRVGAKPVVLTFHPHPSVILRGRTGSFYLTTVPEKVKLLDELGTDIVISHPFTYELSRSTAREFVLYLMEHLGFRQLWTGYDFALGKGREGNVEYLRSLGAELNFQVHVVKPITSDGQTISSSQIRNLLMQGSVEEANKSLGRPYKVTGEVIHGDGRGKSIGIPTANLDTGNEKLIPGAGVYACRVVIMDKLWPAAVNIGTRPTFESADQRAHVEAHILDYSNDIYAQQITIEFISRLRGEQRFQGVEELISQIHNDINKTRELITG
ncbi:MAG: riboflavin biosynthesis protein RibF [Chloroflexi bacterium RBG_16_47_49]|nr:MAG: riboflavin biosynthesis protein RibF [Chloroflexi bacterium RBG_16_47_49]